MTEQDETTKKAKTIELEILAYLLFIVGFVILGGSAALFTPDFSPVGKIPIYLAIIAYVVARAGQKKDGATGNFPPSFISSITFIVAVVFVVITWFMDYTLNEYQKDNRSTQRNQDTQDSDSFERNFKYETPYSAKKYIEQIPRDSD